MKAFVNAETVLTATDRRIEFTAHDVIGPRTSGTFNAIPARLLGLSYPNYLRYVREKYNAVIIGRTGYPYVVFKDSKDCDRLVAELNRRWDAIMKEREKRGLKNGEDEVC